MSATVNGERTDMIVMTIDGVEVSVPTGTRVLEAAEWAGITIPHYCYHPGIPTAPAQCRMCLVEVEGQGKLQPSCVLPAQDGMVVRTASDTVRTTQRAVIEFLLLNHPLDCPICDAAGQCMLQDYAHETGQLESRFREEKLVLGRDKIADDILYFGDRCILCTRCVRFMEDVAGDNSLVVAQRGHRAYIDTFTGAYLDNPFRGNIVDVCPVGALVHEDFLFKARAWDMDSAPSVCPGCSTGCNISLNVKENHVVRAKPRFNPDVNAYWMCDHGRKLLVMANRGERPEVPLVSRGDRAAAMPWDEALGEVAHRLGAGPATVIVSARESNENLFYLRRILDHLGIADGSFRVPRGDEAVLAGLPTLKLRSERAPNRAGAEIFGFSVSDEVPRPATGDTLIVMGDALRDMPEDYAAGAAFFLYIGSHISPATRRADAILPTTTFAEMDGTFVNFGGRVQRFHQAIKAPGVARPAWMVLSRLAESLGAGTGVLDIRAAVDAMAAGSDAFQSISWRKLGLKGMSLADAPAGVRLE